MSDLHTQQSDEAEVSEAVIMVSASRDAGMLLVCGYQRAAMAVAFRGIDSMCDLSGVDSTPTARGERVSLALTKLIQFHELPEDAVEASQDESFIEAMNEIVERILYVAESETPGITTEARALHCSLDGSVLSIRRFDDFREHADFIERVEGIAEDGRTSTLLN